MSEREVEETERFVHARTEENRRGKSRGGGEGQEGEVKEREHEEDIQRSSGQREGQMGEADGKTGASNILFVFISSN